MRRRMSPQQYYQRQQFQPDYQSYAYDMAQAFQPQPQQQQYPGYGLPPQYMAPQQQQYYQ